MLYYSIFGLQICVSYVEMMNVAQLAAVAVFGRRSVVAPKESLFSLLHTGDGLFISYFIVQLKRMIDLLKQS